jgi:hypothetical protein
MAAGCDELPGIPTHEIEVYLLSGQHDSAFRAWPGKDFLARTQSGNAALRRALISAVRERTRHATYPEALIDMDVVAFTRGKVTPMVRGLFPAAEQEQVLDTLARSVVFLTPATIDGVLEQPPWLSTAWKLANLYLADCGADLLGEDAPYLAGLSEGTTCYLSAGYFDQSGRFDDFLVHEAAHIFHNCKRVTIGLPETRRKEWLLEINYGKRETFAYACEAYSRIHELADSAKGRQRLLAEHELGPMPADERVNADEYMDILREAVTARNGWKRILQRCSPIAR